MKRVHLILVLLILFSTACGGLTPALPTIDVIKAAQQTMVAAPTQMPAAAPTADHPMPAQTVVIQPTPLLRPSESIAVQPTTVLNNLRVLFVDVGEGDATLLLAPDGKTALIDGGEADAGLVPYLQSIGVSRIDLMIATHPHSEHIGGLVQVLQAMPVTTVVANGQVDNTSVYGRFLDAIAAAKAQYLEVKRGDTLTLGSLTFNVLNPVSNTGEDLNNNSVVLRLVYGKVAFLFMSDAERDAEASILSAGLPVQAQIIKVGDHGSKTSSSRAFLAQVKPEVAVYFAGQGNPYGYPDIVALSALTATGAKIYGTNVHGTITVTTDGNGYQVSPAKEQPPIVVQATQPPAPRPLTLDIVTFTNPVTPGGKATLVARTLPGAVCTVTLYDKSGPNQASGLDSKTADGEGRVAWTWKVRMNMAPGTWQIVVAASLNGQTVTQEISFVVQR